MDPFPILVGICACDDAASTFHALADAVAEAVPLHAAFRIRASDGEVLETRPESLAVSSELGQAAARALHPGCGDDRTGSRRRWRHWSTPSTTFSPWGRSAM